MQTQTKEHSSLATDDAGRIGKIFFMSQERNWNLEKYVKGIS